ncbi:ribonuclease H-like domain-containing protein [Aspergillus karnatakaensis]|uniref:ribonuclease H-like domain-containing protein n=1 Tax=Aspergillus karnatakaensis TaxID=1810916 RepID=UPI003CCDC552
MSPTHATLEELLGHDSSKPNDVEACHSAFEHTYVTLEELLRSNSSKPTRKDDAPDILALTEFLKETKIEDKTENKQAVTLVSTPEQVSAMLESIKDLPTNPPSLYIDLEGVNLSRHGTISILQIYVAPRDETYLVDVYTLKEKAFSTPSSSLSSSSASSNSSKSKTNGNGDSKSTTLKSLLESPTTPKVIFDVRNDSDALYAHYNIHLAGIHDLQLMELATRSFPRRYVQGLARCIECDAKIAYAERAKWKEAKEKGVRLFAPERGGSYEVFNERPLRRDIVEYCVQDVKYLPVLWGVYDRRLTRGWRGRVEGEVRERIALSQSAGFCGKGRNMALAPGGWD